MIWRLIIITGLMFYCSLANAWNYAGHVLVAQVAYNNLTPENKLKADQLAALIFNRLPYKDQQKLDNQYYNASTFAKVALLPDVWRKWKIGTLFNKFNAPVPINLLLFSGQSTAEWHFVDNAYPATPFCNPVRPTNVTWALQKIKPDLQRATNENTKALLMVLTEHYIGDIHQPLHTLTHISQLSCNGDAGGNDFCLKMNNSGKCTKNLHSLWDSGVGFIKPHHNIQQTAYELQKNYPALQFSQEINDENLLNWVQSSYKNAEFIYSTAENNKPAPSYYQAGQLIAQKQIVLAGYRLAKELNDNL